LGEKTAIRSPFFTPSDNRKAPSFLIIAFISFQDMSTYFPSRLYATQGLSPRRATWFWKTAAMLVSLYFDI
jgi:hypothetical protein